VKHLNRQRILGFAALLASAALAACGGGKGEDRPRVSSGPPPQPIQIPPQPGPPMGASNNLVVPPLGPDGVRRTVNAGISPPQALWNLRSAYNVAALNCRDEKYAPILTGYRSFLTSNAKTLTAANKKLEAEFKTRYGTGFARIRDVYMTQVYNFYALPTTLPFFCDAALAMNAQAQGVKSSELESFAARAVPQMDQVFESFFLSYEQYRTDLSGWQARYAPPPAAISLAPFDDASQVPGLTLPAAVEAPPPAQ
jgi:hypothetical protein